LGYKLQETWKIEEV